MEQSRYKELISYPLPEYFSNFEKVSLKLYIRSFFLAKAFISESLSLELSVIMLFDFRVK